MFLNLLTYYGAISFCFVVGPHFQLKPLKGNFYVLLMGLEPIISAVKGQRVNQLLYSSKTIRASDRIRTYDLLITNQLHYRCATEAKCE